MQRTYTVKSTGQTYPLFEAPYDQSFQVRRAHCKIAVIGDPENCIEALGIKQNTDVVAAYVGSGQDAYVVFKPNEFKPFEHALHFVILAEAARVRDAFDTRKDLKKKTLTLHKPTGGRTLTARAALGKRRRDEIKNGTGAPIKPRGKQKAPRIVRLGVDRRPRAMINRSGVTL